MLSCGWKNNIVKNNEARLTSFVPFPKVNVVMMNNNGKGRGCGCGWSCGHSLCNKYVSNHYQKWNNKEKK